MSTTTTTSKTTSMTSLHLRCHCATFAHTVEIPTSEFPLKSSVCHCTTCRRVTGHLVGTFAVLPRPFSCQTHDMGATGSSSTSNEKKDQVVSSSSSSSSSSFVDVSSFPTQGLKAYNKTAGLTRWFCGTCGASCFNDDRGSGKPECEIATGIVHGVEVDGKSRQNGVEGLFDRVQLWIGDTGDGGAAVWINAGRYEGMDRRIEGRDSGIVSDEMLNQMVISGKEKTKGFEKIHGENDLMKAVCSCGSFNLQIPVTDGVKLKAGVDACTSCRVVSGFELTIWAAIPISSVTKVFELTSSDTVGTYKTSEKVTRFFCNGCGATIFYLNDDRDTIDIGVGLIEAKDGARAESLLTWDKYGNHGVVYVEDAIDKTFVEGLLEGRMATIN